MYETTIKAFLLTNEEEKSWVCVTEDPYIGSLSGEDPVKLKKAMTLALHCLGYSIDWLEVPNKKVVK